MLFFFLMFEAIGYTIIYTIILQQHIRKLEEGGNRSNENRFDFHFIPNCLKALKVINWKL